jgi:hypothetical protein
MMHRPQLWDVSVIIVVEGFDTAMVVAVVATTVRFDAGPLVLYNRSILYNVCEGVGIFLNVCDSLPSTHSTYVIPSTFLHKSTRPFFVKIPLLP